MKTLAMTILLSGLLSAGVAFASESKPMQHCENACASCQQDSTFQPLFPEYEVQPPLGG